MGEASEGQGVRTVRRLLVPEGADPETDEPAREAFAGTVHASKPRIYKHHH
jgi:hypothetical protein